jgi:hypothetical protein
VRRQRELSLDGREDRVASAREGDEERIPLRVDLVTSVRSERLAQQPLMFRKHLSVALAQLLEQPRRSLDVGEQEGDGARRQLSHRPQRAARFVA